LVRFALKKAISMTRKGTMTRSVRPRLQRQPFQITMMASSASMVIAPNTEIP
jgi:hypothetical protein